MSTRWTLLLVAAVALLASACGSTATGGAGGYDGGSADDAAGQDGAGQDGAGQDGAGQDSAGQDGAGQDGAGQDGTGQDGVALDGAATDDGGDVDPGADVADSDDSGSDGEVFDDSTADATASDGGDGDDVLDASDGQDADSADSTDPEVSPDADGGGPDGASDDVSDVAPDSAEPDSNQPDGVGGWVPVFLLKQGDLVITEVMADPSVVGDEVGEWFEIHNKAPSAVNIVGMLIEDKNAKPHEVKSDAALMIPAGGYAVLCTNADKATNGGVDCLYAFGDKVKLSNSADTIKIASTATVLDQVDFASGGDKGWPTILKGHSQQLMPDKLDASANDDGGSWCVAQEPYGAGDFGSPGKANPVCVADLDKDGIPDAKDNCPTAPNSSQFDEDTDGVGSACDNCPKVANADQKDSDLNGVGDACPAAVCGDGSKGEGEECDDGNKADGDGCSISCKIEAASLKAGDLVITELLIDPVAVDDNKGEYVELYNPTDKELVLDGLVIVNKTIKHTIAPTTPLKIAAKGYLVLGINGDAATNGGVKVDYVWKTIALGNSGSDIALQAGDVTIDKVAWPGSGSSGWPKYKEGASIQLSADKLSATANDDGANWCPSTAEVPGGDKGTPGKANATCPAK